MYYTVLLYTILKIPLRVILMGVSSDFRGGEIIRGWRLLDGGVFVLPRDRGRAVNQRMLLLEEDKQRIYGA